MTQEWKCRLGLHDWTPWETVYRTEIVSLPSSIPAVMAEPKDWCDTGRNYEQHRTCRGCGRLGARFERIRI